MDMKTVGAAVGTAAGVPLGPLGMMGGNKVGGAMGGIGDFLGENGKSIGMAVGAIAAVGLLSKLMGKDMNPLVMLGVGAAAFFGGKMLMGGGEKHADGESVTASASPNAASQGNDGPEVG